MTLLRRTWKTIGAAAVAVASLLQAQTFSPNRITNYQSNYIREQSIIARETPPPPPPPVTGVIPPPGILGYSPLVIVNNSGIDPSQIYFVAKGGPAGMNSFLQPNLSTGICSLVSANTNNSADPSISVRLSQLPSAGTNAYFLYFPLLNSQRCYLSIGSPLYMKTSGGNIDDPSQSSVQDPNYYVLYQNFESTLTVTDSGTYELYANVTNVDFFSLPFTLGSYSYPSGTLYPTLDNLTQVGFPPTLGRTSILSSIATGLATDPSSPQQWPRCVIPFYTNPYAVSSPLTDLRVLAAKLDINLGTTSVQFVGGANTQLFFDPTYIQNSSKGPVAMQSYVTALWNYYMMNTLQITVYPGDPPPTATYTMSSIGSMMNPILRFTTSTMGATSPIDLPLQYLTTEALLSGDVGLWVFTPSGTGPYQTEISKAISALFTAGLLPPPLLWYSRSKFAIPISAPISTHTLITLPASA